MYNLQLWCTASKAQWTFTYRRCTIRSLSPVRWFIPVVNPSSVSIVTGLVIRKNLRQTSISVALNLHRFSAEGNSVTVNLTCPACPPTAGWPQCDMIQRRAHTELLDRCRWPRVAQGVTQTGINTKWILINTAAPTDLRSPVIHLTVSGQLAVHARLYSVAPSINDIHVLPMISQLCAMLLAVAKIGITRSRTVV
jgi:hypothetical protein